MIYYKITIKNYYYQAPYHDFNGLTVMVERNDRELQSWDRQDDIDKDYNRTIEKARNIAEYLQKENKYEHLEKEHGLFKIYDSYSIGD